MKNIILSTMPKQSLLAYSVEKTKRKKCANELVSCGHVLNARRSSQQKLFVTSHGIARFCIQSALHWDIGAVVMLAGNLRLSIQRKISCDNARNALKIEISAFSMRILLVARLVCWKLNTFEYCVATARSWCC